MPMNSMSRYFFLRLVHSIGSSLPNERRLVRVGVRYFIVEDKSITNVCMILFCAFDANVVAWLLRSEEFAIIVLLQESCTRTSELAL